MEYDENGKIISPKVSLNASRVLYAPSPWLSFLSSPTKSIRKAISDLLVISEIDQKLRHPKNLTACVIGFKACAALASYSHMRQSSFQLASSSKHCFSWLWRKEKQVSLAPSEQNDSDSNLLGTIRNEGICIFNSRQNERTAFASLLERDRFVSVVSSWAQRIIVKR